MVSHLVPRPPAHRGLEEAATERRGPEGLRRSSIGNVRGSVAPLEDRTDPARVAFPSPSHWVDSRIQDERRVRSDRPIGGGNDPPGVKKDREGCPKLVDEPTPGRTGRVRLHLRQELAGLQPASGLGQLGRHPDSHVGRKLQDAEKFSRSRNSERLDHVRTGCGHVHTSQVDDASTSLGPSAGGVATGTDGLGPWHVPVAGRCGAPYPRRPLANGCNDRRRGPAECPDLNPPPAVGRCRLVAGGGDPEGFGGRGRSRSTHPRRRRDGDRYPGRPDPNRRPARASASEAASDTGELPSHRLVSEQAARDLRDDQALRLPVLLRHERTRAFGFGTFERRQQSAWHLRSRAAAGRAWLRSRSLIAWSGRHA